MCGKSIRVPNLDGSIEPIPSPELDLADSQLVKALGELAGIGKPPSPGEVTSPPKFLETQDATVISPAAEPIPRPKAVPAQPVPSAASGDSETIIQAAEDGGTVIQGHDPLRALADSSPRQPAVRQTPGGREKSSSSWILSLSAIAIAGLLAIVWLNTGSKTLPPVLEASSDQSAPPTKQDAAPPAAAPDSGPAAVDQTRVSGRVTYVSENGNTRPDVGASIVLLPQSKAGTVRLDVAGFLAGAESVDVAVARSAIRALGGDVATAGEDGRYDLNVAAAGKYHLLAISHHVARNSPGAVEEGLQEVLAAYFFRPASLLGGLSFHFEVYHSDGQATAPHDFSFSGE